MTKINELFIINEAVAKSPDAQLQKEFKAFLRAKDIHQSSDIKISQIKAENGKINVSGPIVITNKWFDKEHSTPLEELPYKFGRTGCFIVMFGRLKSFKNFPDEVNTIGAPSSNSHYALVMSRYFSNQNITTLEGITRYIYGSVDFQGIPQVSFSNVHKHIHTIMGHVKIHPLYKGPLLGFLKVDGIELMMPGLITELTNRPEADRLFDALKIINKHLKGDKDILKAQEELIEAGLKEYAKL